MAKEQLKTTQALKVSAYWTPGEETAAAMTNAVFGEDSQVFGARVAGGRTLIKCALKVDFSDPSSAARASERIAQIKAALEASGKVHKFSTQAGAAPVAQVVDLEQEGTDDE